MTKAGIKDMAASVRARLLNLARQAGKPYDEVLVQYALERFLFQLSKSPHQEHFLLKGGLLLLARGLPQARPTRDIDLLGLMPNDVDAGPEGIRLPFPFGSFQITLLQVGRTFCLAPLLLGSQTTQPVFGSQPPRPSRLPPGVSNRIAVADRRHHGASERVPS